MTVEALTLRRVIFPVRRALQNDFLRHSALVFAATMVGNILNYLFNFAISRKIGVENFATLTSLVSGLMILSIPGTIVNLVVVKYTATFHAVSDHARLWRLSEVLLKWTTSAAAILFAVGLLLRSSAAAFLHIPNDTTITLSLAIMAVGFIMPSVRGILQGEQDFRRFAASLILEVSLKVGLAVPLVYLGFGVRGAMSGWLVGSCTALLYTVWAVRKHRVPLVAPAPLALDLRRLAKTSMGVALATGSLTLLSFTDVVLVKHYFDAYQAGLYSAVNLTGKVVLFLVSFLPTIVLPKAVAKAERGEPSARLLLHASMWTVMMAGVALTVFGTVPHTIIRLIAGAPFTPASPYVLSYDIAMAFLAIVTLLVSYKIGLHRFDFLYGIMAVLVGEVVAISVWYHHSLWDVIHVLMIGNLLAIIACSRGIVPKISANESARIGPAGMVRDA